MKQFMLGVLLLFALFGCGVDWFPSNQPEITTQVLPSGIVGTSYSQTISAVGGTPPLVWGISSGILPPGLTISSAGLISGTPTKGGTFRFTVIAADSHTKLTGTHTYTVMIIAATPLKAATPGISYNAPLTATGTSPFTWTLADSTLPAGTILPPSLTVGLPPGLAVVNSQGEGAITGTPTTPGDFLFPLTVTDSSVPAVSVTNWYTIHVGVSITTSSLAFATVSSAYLQRVDAQGGTKPYTWSITGLPSGLGFRTMSSAAVISGRPTVAGTSNVTIKVTDSASPVSTANTILPLTVNPAQ